MSLLRQLPELFIRGSVANITMAGLTPEQIQEAGEITSKIALMPEMQAKRRAFANKLASTIGADYKSDYTIADEEYYIAIWRGVVAILYHKKYEFKCRVCNATQWVTKRGIPKNIDRQAIPCPNCKKLQIDKPGDSGLESGACITKEEYDIICDNIPYKENGDYGWVTQDLPTCISTIDYIELEKEDLSAILQSDQQTSRFFGEYVWNYCKQQLAENERKEHNKKKIIVSGPADEIIFGELIAICKKMCLDFCFDDRLHDNEKYVVYINTKLTPPEFTAEYIMLRTRALQFGIKLYFDDKCIYVFKSLDTIIIQSTISLAEHVLFQEDGVQDSDSNVFSVHDVAYRTVEGINMDQDDHIEQLESSETMQAIREALPDGDCKIVFDIFSQQGPSYMEFSDRFGKNQAKRTHIAQFLGITPRQVGIYYNNIKTYCLVYNMLPR